MPSCFRQGFHQRSKVISAPERRRPKGVRLLGPAPASDCKICDTFHFIDKKLFKLQFNLNQKEGKFGCIKMDVMTSLIISHSPYYIFLLLMVLALRDIRKKITTFRRSF